MSAVEATTIHYYGAKWCSPCKIVKPRVEELAKRFSVPLTVFDIDDMEEGEEKSKISKLPTIRVCKPGIVMVEFITRHVEQLEAWLKSNVRVNTDEDF
jgi:thiol-disulfide isomerase/thioredoxin